MSMNKRAVVAAILGNRLGAEPLKQQGQAYAPTNIALCKYWGKRDSELNLPMTASLSISLGDKGAHCQIQSSENEDLFRLNGQEMPLNTAFSQRLKNFLDLFRSHPKQAFQIETQMNIPMAAGLASSACGYASVVLALNDHFAWSLSSRELSILARLGSGSACRSITPGFVEWQVGVDADGMDSYGEVLAETWPELRVGLLLINKAEKPLSSRLAMERTIATSPLYGSWPAKVKQDLPDIKAAIQAKDFKCLGQSAESNALTMHALMLSAWPPISYALPETIAAMHQVWKLREQGLELYFTQDAGPNLKLLFCQKDLAAVEAAFPAMEVVQPS